MVSVYDIQNSSLTNRLFVILDILNIIFELIVLVTPPSQSGNLKGSNTSIILLAPIVLLEATDSLLTGSACPLLGVRSCCCTSNVEKLRCQE